MSYRDSQARIDDFDGVSSPGTMTVQLDEATGRVMYYEGSDTIRFNELTIAATDPAGGIRTPRGRPRWWFRDGRVAATNYRREPPSHPLQDAPDSWNAADEQPSEPVRRHGAP